MPSCKEIHKAEATDFVSSFYSTSWDWRQESYHDKWDTWEGNYRGIYDSDIEALKESWQAKMFIPVTSTNVEVIGAALQKILLGKETPIGVKPRELGDRLQAELNTQIVSWAVEKQFPDCVQRRHTGSPHIWVWVS